MHVKLLSSEAFFSPNEEISLSRRVPHGPAGGAESAPPEPLAGLNFPGVMPISEVPLKG